MKPTTLEAPVDAVIEIFGHRFNGIKDIKNAVEVCARYNDMMAHPEDKKNIKHKKAANPVPGIYVLELWEPYPCFDEHDYAYEHRYYGNYFFSRKPFKDNQIFKLAQMRSLYNYQLISDELNSEAIPAVHYGGDSSNPLIIFPNDNTHVFGPEVQQGKDVNAPADKSIKFRVIHFLRRFLPSRMRQ